MHLIIRTAAPASTKTPANVPPDKCTPNTAYFYYGTQISTAWGQGCGYNSNCPGNPYGPCQHSSDAYDYSIVPALQNSLGYTSARLIAYDDNAIPTIQNDIRYQNEPVLFIGWDNNGLGGHIWVGDGYAIAGILSGQCTISYEMAYYHMNWGWGEIGANNYIGWYYYDQWAADGYDFGTNREVVLDIHP